jgi:hypothetical protein
VKTKTKFSKGKFIGKPRGNLECGSAQPSLFYIPVMQHHKVQSKVHGNIQTFKTERLKLIKVIHRLRQGIVSPTCYELYFIENKQGKLSWSPGLNFP